MHINDDCEVDHDPPEPEDRSNSYSAKDYITCLKINTQVVHIGTRSGRFILIQFHDTEEGDGEKQGEVTYK